MKLLNICNRIIEYSFYALFLLVPLAFRSDTSELFELNKMWLVWGLTIIIATAWSIKMVLQRKFFIQRTPLDIPIGLFLLSQIISTIFSLDFHTSLWGYYSRFNGGLLSIISYILLYYAFLSNFDSQKLQTTTHKLLTISLVSGLIVALWGLPSHFGYDPTCLLFRGTFDVSCWTADFLPKVRIFSTLGQPDWLAAYLAILIPITIAFLLKNSKSEALNPKQSQNSNSQIAKTFLNFGNWNLFRISIFVLLILFYVDLLYTRARSGFLGIWLSLIFFAAAYIFIETRNKKQEIRRTIRHLLPITCLFLLVTFVIGTPINQLNKFTLSGIGSLFQKTQTPKNQTQSIASGITESGDIRLLVWEGAINAWKANPIFGTGVETFAFAYYKYKPVGQNLTSEWNFLYNKAHNEYLNYLATTGFFGLGTYLLMIGYFLFLAIKQIFNSKFLISNQIPNSKSQLGQLEIRSIRNLSLALLASYVSILITNFFGFSVVIVNVYLFMTPAFVFVLTGFIKTETSNKQQEVRRLSPAVLTCIFFILITSCFLLVSLFNFWRADIVYALGSNLDRAREYQQAYSNLHKAVQLRTNEPVFKDELSFNDAIIAVGLVSQNATASAQVISVASSLTQEAINTSNEVVSQHPNNVVFWKTRTKLFLTLSQVDSRYLPRALDAIEKASLLAPNDANIWYNLGVLYGQNNNLEKGIEALEKTIILKPNYQEAHYALGLFYHAASQDAKAIAQMQFILNHISANDKEVKQTLQTWGQ